MHVFDVALDLFAFQKLSKLFMFVFYSPYDDKLINFIFIGEYVEQVLNRTSTSILIQ
jgi:hypothetical protein